MAIDLRRETPNFARHIVDAINSMSKIKQEQINVEKAMMLDKLERKRGMEDYKEKQGIDLQGYQARKNIDYGIEDRKNQDLEQMLSPGRTAPQPTPTAENQLPGMSMAAGEGEDTGSSPLHQNQQQERPVIIDGFTYPHPRELLRAEGKVTPQLLIYANAYNKFAYSGEGSAGEEQIMKKMVGLDKVDKTKEEIAAGQRLAGQSFSMVSGSLQELAQTYADAVKEEGIGSKGRQIVAGARLWAGGKQAEKLSATSAFPGQKTEVIARMMPILTQQGDKPGSVRLVQTVFDKLEKTLPEPNTPPKNARRMMEQTVRNMYRFARASSLISEQHGVSDSNYDSLSGQEKQKLTNQLEQLANTISLSPDEEDQINTMLNSALSPIDKLIQSRGGDVGTAERSNSNFVEGKVYRDDKGNRARYQGGHWVPVQ